MESKQEMNQGQQEDRLVAYQAALEDAIYTMKACRIDSNKSRGKLMLGQCAERLKAIVKSEYLQQKAENDDVILTSSLIKENFRRVFAAIIWTMTAIQKESDPFRIDEGLRQCILKFDT
jgi:hypothetical protein